MSSERADLRAPLGHLERIEGLWRSAASGRLPHALLARGPRGTGKFLALRWLAHGLHCASGPGAPCGTCGPCKRFRSGNHPDHLEIDVAAEGETAIKVDRIAERDSSEGPTVGGFLSLRPAESRWRTVVVREAERMNEAAQNAFLKTLEEPAPGTVLMLETSEPGRLLATVHSRVVSLALERLSGDQVASVLAALDVPAEELSELARWARGAPGRALEDRERGLFAARAELLAWLAGDLPAHEATRRLLELEGEFPGKTPLARSRARVAALLELGLDLLADEQRLAAGVPAHELVHGPALGSLRLGAAERERLLDRWLLARQDVERNVGLDGALARALDRSPNRSRPNPSRPDRTGPHVPGGTR